MNFKEDGFMVAIGLVVVALVLGQSLSFLLHAIKRGKQLGIEGSVMKSVALSSALFSITPALAIVATILALAPALGTVLPWIRLSVIGNLIQETSAATAALDAVGSGGMTTEITDPTVFTTVAWVMALGSIMPLVVLPLVLKRLQRGMKKVSQKDTKLTDALSAAAFIGLIATFIARALIGQDTGSVKNGEFIANNDGAGVMTVITLLAAVVFMLLLKTIADKKNIAWLENFAMPISMFAALGVAVLLIQLLPQSISELEWRPVTALIYRGVMQ